MNKVIELDEFNIHEVLSDLDGVALVFFSGPHCASCHHLKALLDAEYQQFIDHFVGFSAFEVKADKAAALVNEFGVFHLPSMYIYKNGAFHCELQAEATPLKIIDEVDRVLSLPPQEEP